MAHTHTHTRARAPFDTCPLSSQLSQSAGALLAVAGFALPESGFCVCVSYLTQDVQEFHPYVFQIFAQLIELRQPPLPPVYMQVGGHSSMIYHSHCMHSAALCLSRVYNLNSALQPKQTWLSDHCVCACVCHHMCTDLPSPLAPSVLGALWQRPGARQTIAGKWTLILLVSVYIQVAHL